MPLDQRKYLVTVSFMQCFSTLLSTLCKTGVSSFFPLIQASDAASWGVWFLFLRSYLKRRSSCVPLVSTLTHDLLLLSQSCVSQASLRLMGSCQAEGIGAEEIAAHSYELYVLVSLCFWPQDVSSFATSLSYDSVSLTKWISVHAAVDKAP